MMAVQLSANQATSLAFFAAGCWTALVAWILWVRELPNEQKMRDNRIGAIGFVLLTFVAIILAVLSFFGVGGFDAPASTVARADGWATEPLQAPSGFGAPVHGRHDGAGCDPCESEMRAEAPYSGQTSVSLR